jgi:hypothetical protein
VELSAAKLPAQQQALANVGDIHHTANPSREVTIITRPAVAAGDRRHLSRHSRVH